MTTPRVSIGARPRGAASASGAGAQFRVAVRAPQVAFCAALPGPVQNW
jgi:hypothetical protein